MDQSTRVLEPPPEQESAPPRSPGSAPPAPQQNYTSAPVPRTYEPPLPPVIMPPLVPPVPTFPAWPVDRRTWRAQWRTQRAAWRAERRAARAAWRAQRRAYWGVGSGWVGGTILIVLGAVFLLGNAGLALLPNWWALFILIPACAAFAGAWMQYERMEHQFTIAVAGSLVAGLLLLGITLVALFAWELSLLVPALLILGGLALLANTYRTS